VGVPAIGFVRLGALGDVVRLLALAGPAKRRFEARRLVWLTGSALAPLVRANPEVDEVVELPPLTARTALAWVRTAATLRRRRMAVCFDLQGLAKSGFLTWASGAPLRLGLARDRAREGSALAVHAFLPMRPRTRYEEALERLALDWEDWRRGAEKLRAVWGIGGGARRGIVLHPGGSAPNRYKRWPPERFIEAARRLRRLSSQPVLVQYGNGERPLAEGIAAEVPGAAVVTSESALDMARRLGEAALFVGGDTGPLHVAILAGTPAVAVYGPSDPHTYALPPGTPHRIVRAPLPCSPCRHRTCRTVECLERVTAQEVADAGMELLQEVR
jgi:lipopolysaccharide heptosyltransferase I